MRPVHILPIGGGFSGRGRVCGAGAAFGCKFLCLCAPNDDPNSFARNQQKGDERGETGQGSRAGGRSTKLVKFSPFDAGSVQQAKEKEKERERKVKFKVSKVDRVKYEKEVLASAGDTFAELANHIRGSRELQKRQARKRSVQFVRVCVCVCAQQARPPDATLCSLPWRQPRRLLLRKAPFSLLGQIQYSVYNTGEPPLDA